MTPRPRHLAPLAVALLLAGCGKSPPTVTLTLDPAPPAAVRADYRGPAIAVPAVHMPATLDRIAFVSQPAAGEAKIHDFASWAAPLGILSRDALVRDLTARLPAGSVLPPGTVAGKGARAIDVTVLGIGWGPGQATMQAAWRTLPAGTVHQEALAVPAASGDPVPSAQALTALLGQLADRIAAALPPR